MFEWQRTFCRCSVSSIGWQSHWRRKTENSENSIHRLCCCNGSMVRNLFVLLSSYELFSLISLFFFSIFLVGLRILKIAQRSRTLWSDSFKWRTKFLNKLQHLQHQNQQQVFFFFYVWKQKQKILNYLFLFGHIEKIDFIAAHLVHTNNINTNHLPNNNHNMHHFATADNSMRAPGIS